MAGVNAQRSPDHAGARRAPAPARGRHRRAGCRCFLATAPHGSTRSHHDGRRTAMSRRQFTGSTAGATLTFLRVNVHARVARGRLTQRRSHMVTRTQQSEGSHDGLMSRPGVATAALAAVAAWLALSACRRTGRHLGGAGKYRDGAVDAHHWPVPATRSTTCAAHSKGVRARPSWRNQYQVHRVRCQRELPVQDDVHERDHTLQRHDVRRQPSSGG